MISWPYLLFIWQNHRGFVFFSGFVVAGMQVIVITLISNVEVTPILKVLMEQLPQQFQAVINNQLLAGLSVKGAAAFGLNHPLVLTLLSINAITIPNRHISGEIEAGTLELLLAYPMQRTKLLLSLWASSALLLLFVVALAVTASLAALGFTAELNPTIFIKMLEIAASLWALIVAVMTLTVLLATFGKAGSRVGMWSAGVVLVSYLLDLLSVLWEPLGFLEPVNIFTYFQPSKLMFDQRSFWMNMAVLIPAIAALLSVAVKQFNRRDIPG